jgi:cell division protein FtsN
MQRRPPPRRHHRPSPRSGAGGTLFGIFIGIIVGLGLAAGVAFWLLRNNPSVQIPAITKDGAAANAAAGRASTAPDKPRFDFYKILPGVEEPKIQPERKPDRGGDRAVAEQSRDAASAPKSAPAAPDKLASTEPPAKAVKGGERYWLQAGSFSAQSDAENLKARLALGGWEANVQEGTLPDKGVRYRVRLGPYDDAEELNRMKAELARRGFDVAVIRY